MKILFFLLITLFFATIGFAEVSHQSDETNKKIEKIEEKLDTTKEELIKYTQITEDTKERVSDISGSVDRFTLILSLSIGLFGVLITGIVIFFSFRSTNEAKLEAKIVAQREAHDAAKELLQKWIDKEAKSVFEAKVNTLSDKLQLKGNEILKQIEEKASEQHQRHEEDHQKWMLNLYPTQEEKDEIEKEAKETESKKEEDLTFNDYWIKVVNKLNRKDYENALILIDKAMKLSTNNAEQITALLVAKGAMLGENGKLNEAIDIYDQVIFTHKESKMDIYILFVVMAKFNKGVILGRQGQSNEAIKIYKEIITTYKNSKIEGVLSHVINAIINKLEVEIILDKPISDDNMLILMNKLAHTSKDIALIDMLLILQTAKTSPQDVELQTWLEKYKNVKHSTWGFDVLDGWIEKSNYGEDIKARIRSYIETFKTHLHRT